MRYEVNTLIENMNHQNILNSEIFAELTKQKLINIKQKKINDKLLAQFISDKLLICLFDENDLINLVQPKYQSSIRLLRAARNNTAHYIKSNESSDVKKSKRNMVAQQLNHALINNPLVYDNLLNLCESHDLLDDIINVVKIHWKTNDYCCIAAADAQAAQDWFQNT